MDRTAAPWQHAAGLEGRKQHVIVPVAGAAELGQSVDLGVGDVRAGKLAARPGRLVSPAASAATTVPSREATTAPTGVDPVRIASHCLFERHLPGAVEGLALHPWERDHAVDLSDHDRTASDARACGRASAAPAILVLCGHRRASATGPLSPSDGVVLAGSPLHEQVAGLERALGCNPVALAILTGAAGLGLPSWYLGAGGVAQTVWNQLHGWSRAGYQGLRPGLFRPRGPGCRQRTGGRGQGQEAFAGLGARVDVKNQARVRLWYEERFGRAIEPYRSIEHAISTWPATATSIGVRYEADVFVVCAPFGLADLFSMVVRPIRAITDQAVYEAKAARWAMLWPKLSVTARGSKVPLAGRHAESNQSLTRHTTSAFGRAYASLAACTLWAPSRVTGCSCSRRSAP